MQAIDRHGLSLTAGERVTKVQGDVTRLDFAVCSFDVVLCAEVLVPIPPNLLKTNRASTAARRCSRRTAGRRGRASRGGGRR